MSFLYCIYPIPKQTFETRKSDLFIFELICSGLYLFEGQLYCQMDLGFADKWINFTVN